ncbi:MAG: gentisate 1,2-dioxygenase [Sphingomonadaceae bacterium]|nr:gentisate 1,2-dioxygenase [Sphingomonadaceae bacterium]
MPDLPARPNAQQAQLESLYEEMAPHHLTPLWEVLGDLVLPEPTTPAIPAKWSYGPMREYLLRAGDLITAAEAERRVLILENPGMPGDSAITPRLYAGLQLVLPGEIAPCHRHSQSALRFILEGNGAYTAVDGEKAYMHPFDLILTPNWRWHDHGNPSPDPVIWLDGLDIPTVRALDAQFAERLGHSQHPEGPAPGTTITRFGKSLRPLTSGTVRQTLADQPMFHYPYAEWIEALRALAASQEPDAYIGHAMEFRNPVSGDAVMATISAHVRLFPAGFESGIRRSTESAVFTVVSGAGSVEIDGENFALNPRDVIVVPTWKAARWQAKDELVLFAFSDRTVQEKLNLYRERCE